MCQDQTPTGTRERRTLRLRPVVRRHRQEVRYMAARKKRKLVDDEGHRKHCFVAMPFGRDKPEQELFKGWYEVVLVPAVEAVGFKPVLATNEERPTAITDEIRAHIAFDPLMVVDLAGGMLADAPPNANVMYELGLRHAFNTPVALTALTGQKLPFDVALQRTVFTTRGLIDVKAARTSIAAHLESALNGDFYRPMDAVARSATLQAVSGAPSVDGVLKALVGEVKELHDRVVEISGNTRDEMVAQYGTLLSSPFKTRTVASLFHYRETTRRAFREAFEAIGLPDEWWRAALESHAHHDLGNPDSWGRTGWLNLARYLAESFRFPDPEVLIAAVAERLDYNLGDEPHEPPAQDSKSKPHKTDPPAATTTTS